MFLAKSCECGSTSRQGWNPWSIPPRVTSESTKQCKLQAKVTVECRKSNPRGLWAWRKHFGEMFLAKRCECGSTSRQGWNPWSIPPRVTSESTRQCELQAKVTVVCRKSNPRGLWAQRKHFGEMFLAKRCECESTSRQGWNPWSIPPRVTSESTRQCEALKKINSYLRTKVW